MAAKNEIKIRITGDPASLAAAAATTVKSLDEVGSKADSTSSRMDKFSAVGDKMASAGSKLTAGLTLPIVALGASSVKAFADAEQASAQVGASFDSTGASAWGSREGIEALADELERKHGVDGDAIRSGESLLLTFTNVRNEAGKGNDIFDQSVRLMTDYSVKTGTDATSAAMLFGKALNDPIKGMSALSRAGVQFTEEQKTQIKTMVEAGDVMGAQKVILAELEKQFGGSAEAFGNTAAGGMAKAKFAIENVQEEIGERLIPVVEKMTDVVNKGLAYWDDMSDSQKDFAIQAAGVAAAIGPVLVVGGKLITTIKGIHDGYKSLSATGLSAGPLSALTVAATAQVAINEKMEDSWLAAAGGADVFNRALKTGDIEDYNAALSDTAVIIAGTDLPTNNYERFNEVVRGATAYLGGFGQASVELANSREDMDKWLQLANQRLDDFRASLEGVDPDTASRRIASFGDALRDAGVPADLVTKILRNLRDEFVNSADGATTMTTAVDGAIDPTADLTVEQLASASASKDQAEALKEYSDQMAALYSPIEGFTRANDRAKEAQDKATEALQKYGDKSPEYIKANRDAVSAAVDQESALTRLRQGFADGSVSIEQYTGLMYGLLTSGRITKAQYDEQIGTLLTYTSVVNAIPPSKSTTVTADTDDAKRKLEYLDGLRRRLGTTTGMIITGGLPRELQGRASGGPVRAGQTYMVGEDGPEIVTFGANGYVTPNDKLTPAVAAGASASTWTAAGGTQVVFTGDIIVHNTGDHLDDRDIAAALERVARAGYPIPRFKTAVKA